MDLEHSVLGNCGYSLSLSQILTPFDFFYRYFEIMGGPDRAKHFGCFLLHLICLYPKSLYKFGPKLLAASALYLTFKVCDEYSITWNENLS